METGMSENLQRAIKRLWPLFGRQEMPAAGNLLSRASAVKHAPATMVLHWTTVMALVAAVAAIYLREVTEDKLIRQVLLEAHRQLGLLVLICVPLRIAARYLLGFANQSAGLSALLRWVAAMTHLALYAFLLALPLLGWAATSAKGIKLRLFALVPLPGLADPDPDLADTLVDFHQWGAWTLLALVGAHALAALWHHFVHCDGVLAAMLPNARSRSHDRAAIR
jgi:cytochrome b561